MTDKNLVNIRNGTLRILTQEQTEELYAHTQGRLKSRKVYLKLAVLAVLKYDAQGRNLTADEVRVIGTKYLPRNSGFSTQVVGTILGMLSRMKMVSRSYNRPHSYWWRNNDEL
tara:strand:+ start:418 stop:756 length:339 start_codon:yes stop_codon:yes gene_type:complete